MKSKLLLALLGCFLVAGVGKDDAGKKDLEKMQGDWAAVSMVQDGMKIPDDDAQALFRTIKGNDYTVYRYDKALSKGTFTLDATKKPRTIDFLPANAPNRMPIQGIYEFEGERLKYCYAPPGKPRPADFAAKEGSGHTLTVWEREKKP
jgi:uncharacterized protein (TIGR03067 family)